MTDAWYYAQDGRTVGPLALRDLMTTLGQVPDWKNMLVWRDGIDGWRRAGDIAELAGPAAAAPAPPSTAARPGARARSPSEATSGQGPARKRSTGKLLAGLVLLVAVAIGVAFGNTIGRTVQAQVQDLVQELMQAMLPRRRVATVDKALEERIAKRFEGFEATLPKKVDDVTTLISGTHEGTKVTFGYRLEIDGKLLNDQIKAKVREVATKDICAKQQSREILDLGGSFRLVYTDLNGQPVTAVDIVKSNCS